MKSRSIVAVVAFLILGAVVALGTWYQSRGVKQPAPLMEKAVPLHVTNAGDRGPGTLREAMFLVAGAAGSSSISIEVPSIKLETALPALVNSHGVRLVGQASGAQIDAQALSITATMG